MTSLEREIRNELKRYERFISEEEYEELVQRFLKDLEYQEMIEKLMDIKKCGYNTLDEFEKRIFNEKILQPKHADFQHLNNYRIKNSTRKSAYKLTNESHL